MCKNSYIQSTIASPLVKDTSPIIVVLTSLETGGRSRGGAWEVRDPPYFYAKLRPEGLKNYFENEATSLSEDLDPPLETHD